MSAEHLEIFEFDDIGANADPNEQKETPSKNSSKPSFFKPEEIKPEEKPASTIDTSSPTDDLPLGRIGITNGGAGTIASSVNPESFFLNRQPTEEELYGTKPKGSSSSCPGSRL